MKNIAVIGAGTMGNGIAHTFAQFNYNVHLIDISEESLERGMKTIVKNLDRMVAKEKISEADKKKTLQQIKTFTSIKEGAKIADLVIEAATENTALKIKIFKDITASASPVSLLYESVYKLIIISPATSNTVALMAHGISNNLITNMFAQAGKCEIRSLVFACDTEPVVITQAPKKLVTLYPRDIDLENFKALKKFKNVTVVDNLSSLKKFVTKLTK